MYFVMIKIIILKYYQNFNLTPFGIDLFLFRDFYYL